LSYDINSQIDNT